jgi:hypothetical protein
LVGVNLLIVLLVLNVSGCVGKNPSVDSYCIIDHQIYLGDDVDNVSQETIDMIDEHNSEYEEVCEL